MRGFSRKFGPTDRLPFNKAQNSFLFGIAPAFLVAFLATFFASSILTPVNLSDAANLVSANVSYEGFYVKMSTSDVPMELLTTTTGSMTVVSSTVKAATNSPAGYELYLGISPDDSAGVEKESADKQKNGLYLDGNLSRTDGAVFNATSGTGGKTGTLASLSNNTWGYAVDKNTTGAPDIWANENHTTMTSATPTDDKFAAVPTYGSEDLIQETTTPNVEIDTTESDVQESDYTTASLYYGIRGDISKVAGSYSNTIAYTAVAKTPSPATNITFDPTTYTHTGGTPWADTLTIMTQLYTEASDLGSATVTFLGGPNNVSNLTCANPSVSAIDSLLRISCTLPEAIPGTYDVQIFLDKFDQTFTSTYTYAPETYNVTVNSGTGITSTTGSGSHAVDSTVTLSATPATGYYFDSSTGWTTVSGGITVDSNNQFTMPSSAVEVTANGTLNSCPVTYNSNAPAGTTATGSTANSTMTYGSDAALTTNGYTVTGYAFQGWAETADGSVVFPEGGPISGTTYCTTNGTTKTLYAKWAKKFSYTLNLYMNDGSSSTYNVLNYANTTDTSHTFSLSGQTPTRSGYNFKGWATSSTGTSYISSYTLNSSSAGSTPTSEGFPVSGGVYAIWEVSTPYMQNQTYIDQCKNASTGSTFTLTDQRDNIEYQVRKLADGNCWMVQNLRYSQTGTLSSDTSNVPSGNTFALGSSTTNFSTSCANSSQWISAGSTTFGNFYNWYAATAGQGTCSTTTTVSYDICPRGWKLPTGNTSGQWQTLYNNYNTSAKMRASDGPALVLAGSRYGSSTYSQGSYGYYWSSTAGNANSAYLLYLNTSNVYPANGSNKYYGFSVRCVAK